jgi:phosphatidyl-myo-inositol dimannoside synthase
VKHLFVTQDYPPDSGGMARRHVELVRRFSNETETMAVSTITLENAAEFDRRENYPIYRQPFHFREANRFTKQIVWSRWLNRYARDNVDVLHCGNIRPAGYPVLWAKMRLGIPYIVYVNGGDLLRELKKTSESRLKKVMARRILGSASGIAATSEWVADLTRKVMNQVGVTMHPPVEALALGTDPETFTPWRDTGRLRRKWGVGDDPILLTVARLIPHKGHDVVVRAVARLRTEFPNLRYVIVGEGVDAHRLKACARELHVEPNVIFAGAIPDSDLPEAYATATIYTGASRIDNEINAEGFGISFLEASSSGLPVVAGDSGGVRSAVRDGETGIVLPPLDVDAWANTIGDLLRSESRRRSLGDAGRRAVETFYNWDRVARDTREFTTRVVKNSGTGR